MEPIPGMLSSSEVIVRLGPPLPIVGQTKAVGLVPRALEQPQRGAARGSRRLSERPGRNTSSSRFARLTIGRFPKPKLGGRFYRGTELPLAPVYHDEVGIMAAARHDAGSDNE